MIPRASGIQSTAMDDIVYVSSQAVAKRKRSGSVDEASKKRTRRVQEEGSESSSDSDSDSDSINDNGNVSDNDSDEESSSDSESESDGEVRTARVATEMSAVRISAEPQSDKSSVNLSASIKREHRTDTLEARALDPTQRLESDEYDSMLLSYLQELQNAVVSRFPGAVFKKRPKSSNTRLILRRDIGRVEGVIRLIMRKYDPLRRAVDDDDIGDRESKRWFDETLASRIVQLKRLKGHQKRITNQGKSTRVSDSMLSAKNVHPIDNKIPALETATKEQKALRRKAIKTYKQRALNKEKKFYQEIQEKDKTIRAFQTTQQDLELQLQNRDAEITALKATRMDSTAGSKGEKKAKEALRSAKAHTEAMFTHYDTVQNKNSILIGKLAMMAQAGGFGNHGSAYRKELDALKAPPLTELKEYKEG